jgi:hypothetical protein
MRWESGCGAPVGVVEAGVCAWSVEKQNAERKNTETKQPERWRVQDAGQGKTNDGTAVTLIVAPVEAPS